MKRGFRILLASAVLAGLQSTAVFAADSTPLQHKKVLLVATLTGPTRAIDDSIQKHLESLGMEVTLGDGDHPVPATGYDLVAISDSVKAKTILYTYKDARVPVVTWKPWILQFLGMTGMQPGVDFNEEVKEEQSFLWMVNSPSPLQGGLPNGLMTPVKHAIKQYNWGAPAPSATIVATLPGEPRKAVIFGYEKGALMENDFEAPARRVMFFLAKDQFDTLNENGLKLFDAALTWAVSGPSQSR